MSVTAKQLSKAGARGKDLDAVVREHLQIIDDRLLHADRTWGRNVISYDLPENITLPGLAKKDAQRIVYSALIRSLAKRGFEVKLLLESDMSRVYIAWVTDLDTTEIDAMNSVIRTARIKRDRVTQFVAKGSSESKTAQKVGALAPPAPDRGPAKKTDTSTLPGWAAGPATAPPPGRAPTAKAAQR